MRERNYNKRKQRNELVIKNYNDILSLGIEVTLKWNGVRTTVTEVIGKEHGVLHCTVYRIAHPNRDINCYFRYELIL